MKHRKSMLIDKKFQLRTAFTIIGIVILACSVIIAAIGVIAALNNRTLQDIARNQQEIIATQSEMLRALNVFAQEKTWQNLRIATDKVAGDLNRNAGKIEVNNSLINSISATNSILIIAIIVFVIAQGVVLFVILLRKTHRISGPLYLLSMYTRKIIDGEHPHIRPLRENDEFKEYYDLFIKMAKTIREREEKSARSLRESDAHDAPGTSPSAGPEGESTEKLPAKKRTHRKKTGDGMPPAGDQQPG